MSIITDLKFKFKKDLTSLPIATQTEIKQELYYNTQTAYKELQPVPIKRKQTSVHTLLKRFIADHTYPNKNIQGVLYDTENNKAVATDGKILALYHSCLDAPMSCIMDREGNCTDARKYPPYTKVLPTIVAETHVLSIEDILGKVKAIRMIDETLLPNRPYEGINVKGVSISEKYLDMALQAFYDLGETEIRMSIADRYSPVEMRGDKSLLTIIIMPLRSRSEGCIYSI